MMRRVDWRKAAYIKVTRKEEEGAIPKTDMNFFSVLFITHVYIEKKHILLITTSKNHGRRDKRNTCF